MYKINSHYFFILLSVIAIFPLIILSFFNNPASDDFDYSYESQVEPFWSLQVRRYFDWSGRYFSNGLISLDPLVYNNYFLFKLIPIVLIFAFVLSINIFIGSFKLNISKLEKYSLVGFFSFLYIYQMPSVSEGFYWIPGAFTYLLSQVLVLLFFSMLLKYFQTNSNKNFYAFLTILFLFATMGCNEITVVNLLFIVFILFFYNLLMLKNYNKMLFFILILTISFTVLEVFAPGNATRSQEVEVKHQLVYSILKSFQITVSLMMIWIPIITICCFFLLKSITRIIEEKINKKYIIYPFFSFCIFFSIVYIGVFPCFWSINNPPPGRAANTIYFFFMIAYIYFIISVIYHFVILKKYDFSYSNSTKICIGIIVFIFALSSDNITLAYHDLFSGKAYKYNSEMVARFELIKNCRKRECVLPALINPPKTIYNSEVMGLTNDKNNWKNKEIARYFRKKSIVIKMENNIQSE